MIKNKKFTRNYHKCGRSSKQNWELRSNQNRTTRICGKDCEYIPNIFGLDIGEFKHSIEHKFIISSYSDEICTLWINNGSAIVEKPFTNPPNVTYDIIMNSLFVIFRRYVRDILKKHKSARETFLVLFRRYVRGKNKKRTVIKLDPVFVDGIIACMFIFQWIYNQCDDENKKCLVELRNVIFHIENVIVQRDDNDVIPESKSKTNESKTDELIIINSKGLHNRKKKYDIPIERWCNFLIKFGSIIHNCSTEVLEKFYFPDKN